MWQARHTGASSVNAWSTLWAAEMNESECSVLHTLCVASTFFFFLLHLPNMSHVEHIVNFPADSQLTASCHLAVVGLWLQHHFRLATLLLIYIFITCRSSRSSKSCTRSSCRSRLLKQSVHSFCFYQFLASTATLYRTVSGASEEGRQLPAKNLHLAWLWLRPTSRA